MATLESTFLRPRDVSATTNTHPDDWPELDLTNATVTTPHSNSHTNLLLASEYNPLVLTGDLQPLPKKHAHLYLQPSTKRIDTITIPQVRSFAYGLYDDSSIAIWALGGSAWFTLKPSRAYRKTFADMSEAVKVLYYIADAYKTKKKQRTEMGTRDFFEQCGLHFKADGRELVHKHRDFLLSSMLAGKEGVKWSQNPVFISLKGKFPEDYQNARRRAFGEGEGGQAKRASTIIADDASSTAGSLKRKRGRARNVEVISLAGSTSSAGSVGRRSMQRQEPGSQSRPAKRRSRQRGATSTDEVSDALATPTLQQDDSDEDSAIDRRHAYKGKSGLRLKPTSAAASARSGIAPAPAPDDDNDEPDQDDATTLPMRPSPHAGQKRKRQTSTHGLSTSGGLFMPPSPSPSDPDEAVLGAPRSGTSPLEPNQLNHEPDPVQHDTWRCALAGCNHKVYLASHPTSQTMIRQHYVSHAFDDDERVKMIERLREPSLPTDRLMGKVREQARLEMGGERRGVAVSRYPEWGRGKVIRF